MLKLLVVVEGLMYAQKYFRTLTWFSFMVLFFLCLRRLQVLGVVGGTVGLFEQSTIDITDELLDAYRNQVRSYFLSLFINVYKGMYE